MRWGKGIVAVMAATLALGATPSAAQTFLVYQCADGAQLAVAFFESDTHAHIQLDGKAIALSKRLSISGSRYSGSGITLRITKDGTTLKQGGLPVTTCKALDKW
jgi:membrane-bound inhibitor of C-type lysozyme